MFKVETTERRVPPPDCMFIQLVGIPVPRDRSAVVMPGDVPDPGCRPPALRSHPTQADN